MADVLNVIDAHHHLWKYSASEYGWITPEMNVLRQDFLLQQLEQATRSAGVSGTVAVQARQSLEETEWLLSLADATPLIQGVVGWLPLASEELSALLQRFSTKGKLKGLRHVVQDEPDDFLLDEAFNRGIAALESTGLVYDILIHERQLARAALFARRHPRQVFVLDHLAKPRIREGVVQPWLANLEQLAGNANVYCKLSGLVTEADCARWTSEQLYPYLDAALQLFGAQRLMAGSDWPVCLLASGYQQWWAVLREWTAKLAPQDTKLVLGETARLVYGLG